MEQSIFRFTTCPNTRVILHANKQKQKRDLIKQEFSVSKKMNKR